MISTEQFDQAQRAVAERTNRPVARAGVTSFLPSGNNLLVALGSKPGEFEIIRVGGHRETVKAAYFRGLTSAIQLVTPDHKTFTAVLAATGKTQLGRWWAERAPMSGTSAVVILPRALAHLYYLGSAATERSVASWASHLGCNPHLPQIELVRALYRHIAALPYHTDATRFDNRAWEIAESPLGGRMGKNAMRLFRLRTEQADWWTAALLDDNTYRALLDTKAAPFHARPYTRSGGGVLASVGDFPVRLRAGEVDVLVNHGTGMKRSPLRLASIDYDPQHGLVLEIAPRRTALDKAKVLDDALASGNDLILIPSKRGGGKGTDAPSRWTANQVKVKGGKRDVPLDVVIAGAAQ